MDLLLEGILIAIMMAIILIFVVYEYSTFFAPKSSADYFSKFVGLADSACTSIQTTSNVQFSSPQLFVFQIYDSQACNSVLGSNVSIFSPISSALSALSGNYDLCYATVNEPSVLNISSGNQYYFKKPSGHNVNFYLSKSNAIPNSGNLSTTNNQISKTGLEVNSSSAFSITVTASKPVTAQNYSFDIYEYANTTISLQVYFNGLTSCSDSYTDLTGVKSLSVVSPCTQNIQNVTLEVTPAANSAFNYQLNLTAVSDFNPSNQFLSQQCTSLPSLVQENVIANGSIVCEPISCGGHSFMLTDQSNRPFLGLYGSSYAFLGVQSGVNDLQIVNSYPEKLFNISLMGGTVFQEFGLAAGASWSVTYDGKTKSSIISFTGSGDTIIFSEPYGNYSFAVPGTTEVVGRLVRTLSPKPSNGYAVQGSFVSIDFS